MMRVDFKSCDALHGLSLMASLSMSSRSSVDGAPAGIREVMGSIPVGFFFLRPTFVSCWLFFTELKINHDDFDIAVPSSMQDACLTWTQFNDLALYGFSKGPFWWIRHPPGVREFMGSTPVGDLDFFLCPTLVSCWLFIFIIVMRSPWCRWLIFPEAGVSKTLQALQ